MIKKFSVLYLFLLLLSPIVTAEEAEIPQGQKASINQRTFAKEICTSDPLVTALNEWLEKNPGVEIETLNYFKRHKDECALFIYKIEAGE